MKINWGTSLALAMAGFIAFIMYFVVTMLTDKNFEHDLVTEEYYKKELDFQDQLNKEYNAQSLAENLRVEKTLEGVVIHFPQDLEESNLTGYVFLYRPSNKQLDIKIPLSITSHRMLIPEKHLLGGRWNIEVDWKYNNESYYYKEEVNY